MKKYINVSGRTLSLTGGRLLPPFEYCDLADDSYDQKLVTRGFLQERPNDKIIDKKTEPKQDEPAEESKKKSTTAKKAER